MKVEFRSRGFKLTHSLLEHIAKRIAFATDRLLERVASVRVRVSCESTRHSGNHHLCSLETHLVPSGTILIEERDSNLYRAIDKATDRLGAAAERALKRTEPHKSSSIRHLPEAKSAA